MATNTYYVAVANDDWYLTGLKRFDGTTELLIVNNTIIFPATVSRGLADITTSGIGTDDISAAGLIFDEHSYTSSRGVSKTYGVQIWDGSFWQTLTNGSLTYSGSVRTVVLTAAEIAYINKTGKTSFRWQVGNPGAMKFRQFKIKAFETAQANAARLSVTHAPPSAFHQSFQAHTP